MSAYFSNMDSKCRREGEDPQHIVEQTVVRMVKYLLFLSDSIEPDQRSKLAGFQEVLHSIDRQVFNREGVPVEHIRDLHTLGHDIGHGRLALRGGQFATDNPYFASMFSNED